VALQISRRQGQLKVIEQLSTMLLPILLLETADEAEAYVSVMTKALRQHNNAWRHGAVRSAVLMTISWFIDHELRLSPEEWQKRRALFGWTSETEPGLEPHEAYAAGQIIGEIIRSAPSPSIKVAAEKLSEQGADAARQSALAIEHNLAELDRLTRG
jgi:hypothetical protein